MKALSFKLSSSSLAIPTSSCNIRQQINLLCSRCPGVSSSFRRGPSGDVQAFAGGNGPSPRTTAQACHRSRRSIVCSAGVGDKSNSCESPPDHTLCPSHDREDDLIAPHDKSSDLQAIKRTHSTLMSTTSRAPIEAPIEARPQLQVPEVQ